MQINTTIFFILAIIAAASAFAAACLLVRNRCLKRHFHEANHRYSSSLELLNQENRSLREQNDILRRIAAESILIHYCFLYGQEIRYTVDSPAGPKELVFPNAIRFDGLVELERGRMAVGLCYFPEEDRSIDNSQPDTKPHSGLQYIIAEDDDRAAEKTEPVDALAHYHVLVDVIQESQTFEG